MDLGNKISIERIMNMTLDEYIYESGLFRTPIPPPYKSPHEPSDTEDRFEDITNEIIIKEEEDCEMQNVSDLREKLSSDNSEQPNIRSQQWRLLPPNKSQNRPSGMPPLVPKDKESIHINFTKQSKYNNNNKWGNKWNRNNRNRRHHQQIGGKNNITGVGKRNGFQHRNHRNNQTLPTLGTSPMNMTIEASFDDSLAYSRFQSNESPMRNHLMSNDALSLSSSLGILQPSSVLDSSGGIKLELMPLIAGKLLEALQGANSGNTPKYDLKVQKEIHSLQNKAMVYKCPGGDVVSSDGPGLSCKMTPASTGISLNQRFA